MSAFAQHLVLNSRSRVKQLPRLRVWLDYSAAALACGLGGVLVLLLASIIFGLECVCHVWLSRQGLEQPGLDAWLWSGTIRIIVGIPASTLLAGAAIAVMLAFAYGWWAGMHRIPKLRPPSSCT